MKFREHRNLLDEAMKTLVEVHSWEEFIEHITKIPGSKYIDVSTVKIKPYDDRPDNRISWNKTCIVVAKWIDGAEYPIGFTDCLKEEIC